MTLLLLPRCVWPRPLRPGGKAGGCRRAVKGGPFRGAGKRVSGREISMAAPAPSAARRSAPKAGSGLQAEPPQFSAYLPPPGFGRLHRHPRSSLLSRNTLQGRGCPGCRPACSLFGVPGVSAQLFPKERNKEYSPPSPSFSLKHVCLCGPFFCGASSQKSLHNMPFSGLPGGPYKLAPS